MTFHEDPVSRIERLLTGAEAVFATRFLEVVRLIRDQTTLAQLEQLLSSGQLSRALQSAEIHAARLGNAFTQVYTTAGDSTSRFLGPRLEIAVDFSSVNQFALRTVQAARLRLIAGFTTVQREAVQSALLIGVRRGANPRELARLFRDSIGLTPYQVQVVENYRTALQTLSSDALRRELRDARHDPRVLRAIRTGEPLDPKQIELMVNKYRQSWINFRAENIARTESLRAVHQGTQEMYRQAIEAGQINPASMSRKWNPASDDRVRDSHDAMRGQVVGLQEPFISGLGNRLMYPGDETAPPQDTVNCRCAVSVRFESLSSDLPSQEAA